MPITCLAAQCAILTPNPPGLRQASIFQLTAPGMDNGMPALWDLPQVLNSRLAPTTHQVQSGPCGVGPICIRVRRTALGPSTRARIANRFKAMIVKATPFQTYSSPDTTTRIGTGRGYSSQNPDSPGRKASSRQWPPEGGSNPRTTHRSSKRSTAVTGSSLSASRPARFREGLFALGRARCRRLGCLSSPASHGRSCGTCPGRHPRNDGRRCPPSEPASGLAPHPRGSAPCCATGHGRSPWRRSSVG